MPDTKFTDLTIVGAGGTGSILAPLAARYLTYRQSTPLTTFIIDGDDFDASNATRQPCNEHGSTHLNKAKALAASMSSQGLDHVHPVADFLTTRNADTYICPDSVIILAVDNHATRNFSLRTFADLMDDTTGDMLWISPGNSTGLDAGEIRGTVLWFGRLNGETVGMNPILAVPNIAQPSDMPPVMGSCSAHAPSEPQLLAANTMSAAWTLATLGLVLDSQLPRSYSSLDWSLTHHTFS